MLKNTVDEKICGPEMAAVSCNGCTTVWSQKHCRTKQWEQEQKWL